MNNATIEIDQDDGEVLKLELLREIRLCSDELLKKRELVTDLTKKEKLLKNEVEKLNCQLKMCNGEIQELKAQLVVRTEATQRVEQENQSLRDIVAKLQVQVESSGIESERLLQRWQIAEEERVNWKNKWETLQESALETSSFKEQCNFLQNQLRNTVNKILAQQETVKSEFSKIEKAANDAISFSKLVQNETKRQEEDAQSLLKTVDHSEIKFSKLLTQVTELQIERDQLENSMKEHVCCQQDKTEETNERNMSKIVNGLICENERLLEELTLLRTQMQNMSKCETNPN